MTNTTVINEIVNYLETNEEVIEPLQELVTIYSQPEQSRVFESTQEQRKALLVLRSSEILVGHVLDTGDSEPDWLVCSPTIPDENGGAAGIGFVAKHAVRISERRK